MFDVNSIRKDFPILNQQIDGFPLVYLDNAATTQKPQQVIDSISEFYRTMNCNVHRSIHTLSEQASASYESVRERVQAFLHAKHVDEIVFTSGTTESINIVAQGFNDFISPGDEIIITEMEHHSNIVPWQMLCKRKKATLAVLPIDERGQLELSELPSLIHNRTKLLAVTSVSNVLGTITPIKDFISIAHEQDIPVLVDAAQAMPHLSIDVRNLDCDFLVFSGHKMYAGTGVGVLYGKQDWLERLSPCNYGGGMIDTVDFSKTTFTTPPAKFEAGTRPLSAVISLGAAIKYLEQIGMKDIQDHEQILLKEAMNHLNEIPGISFYGNAEKKCGIISFNLENISHYDAAMILDKQGIAVRSGRHCTDPLMNRYNISGCIRASLGLYNNKQDIIRLKEGLQKVLEMHSYI